MYTEGCGVIFPYSLTIKTACTSCWYLWSYFRCGNFRSLMEVVDSLIVKTKLAKSDWKPTFTFFTSHLVFIFFFSTENENTSRKEKECPVTYPGQGLAEAAEYKVSTRLHMYSSTVLGALRHWWGCQVIFLWVWGLFISAHIFCLMINYDLWSYLVRYR